MKGECPLVGGDAVRGNIGSPVVPRVSTTLKKWGSVMEPFFKGHGRLQVVGL